MGIFSRFKKPADGSHKKLRSAELVVLNKENLTETSAKISFDIPSELKSAYGFEPGQYLNLHCNINGEVLNRSYSICSGKNEPLAVAVKAIPNGKVSNYLVSDLKVGDRLTIDFPQGNFTMNGNAKNWVAFAAGSGITPILSMAKSLGNSHSKMNLYYSNSTPDTALFLNELAAIQEVDLFLYYSRIAIQGTQNSRFNKHSISELIKSDLSLLNADGFYICGPEEMIVAINEVLTVFGVEKEKIHFELFTTPVIMKSNDSQDVSEFKGTSAVTATLDGEIVTVQLATDGKSILDALDAAGLDVPFSCKGGVCCTCKAKIIEGTAKMTINYALSDSEVKEGYILTCQAHPTSETLKLDFDV